MRSILIGILVLAVIFILILLVTGGRRVSQTPTETSPPSTSADIIGHWGSTICESRPGLNGATIYLKRDFTIQTDTWSGDFPYYSDAQCQNLSSIAHISGSYILTTASSTVDNAFDGNFTLDDATITPKSQTTVDYLNSQPAGTCGAIKWSLDTPQSVKSTSGCTGLGLDMKNCGTEFELVKVEDDQLFFGARPTDGTGLCTPAKRPTSFQVPLTRQSQ